MKTAAACVLILAAAILALRGISLRAMFDRVLAPARAAGPVAFFLAMALMPAAGVPMSVFTLTAGRIFGERMGLTGAIAAALAAATADMLLTYWLARWALRSVVARLMGRLGYRMPELDSSDITDLIVFVRVMPGIPFFVQNYLLGLAGAPLWRYLIISCAANWSYTGVFIVFGDALLGGHGRTALIATSLIAALAAATHWLRHHYGKAGRPAAGEPPLP